MQTVKPNESTVNSNPHKRVYRRIDQWRDLVTGFESSGLTLEAYCQQQGIAVSGFYAWRKRFASREDESNPFIELTPPRDNQARTGLSDHAWRIEVALADGVVLRLR